jgi:uncharacterized protein
VVEGRTRVVESPEEKMRALRAFTEHLIPGRWREAREPNRQELDATLVLALPLAEASAKVRTGPPVDDEEDYALPVWAGVLPLNVTTGEPDPDPKLDEGVALPDYLKNFELSARGAGAER